MELYTFRQGFTVLRTDIRLSPHPRNPCLPVYQIVQLTLKAPQYVKNEAISRSIRNPRVCIHRKYTSLLANAYSREGGSKEDAEREVESPDGEKAASQTATVEENERVSDDLASVEEIGKAMKETRKEKEESELNEFWRGVWEETGQIEWPPFERVLGTTGLVLAVIVGSSVVLLTVNAILAELSDKFFGGLGVQDILWGSSK